MKFVTKDEAIETSDVIINAMNLTRIKGSLYNENYFSYDYLSRAKKGLIFINVTRGEIAPEPVLLKLYDQGVLGGIGLDVFSNEHDFSLAVQGQVETVNNRVAAALVLLQMASPLGNIYVQPHQGFNSDLAVESKAADTIFHMISWYQNGKKRFDEQLPYYQDVI
ncbi:MAG: NAD(P)-dependent oxidoreductase [Lawsonibacter sp.]